MPDAVATPPVIVHDVGTNTAGFSPADDNGTEVCTGIVIDGPIDAAGSADADGKKVIVDVSGEILAIELDGGELGEADRLACADGEADGDVDGDKLGDGDSLAGLAEFVGAAAGSALRLAACLPRKYMPIASPTTATNPMIDRFRLLDGLTELT